MNNACCNSYEDVLNTAEKIEKYFNNFEQSKTSLSKFRPGVDISGDNKNIFIELEVPGCKKEDIKVTLKENTISVNGTKKQSESVNERKYYLNERNYGDFSKSFSLGENILSDKIQADITDGILKITLTKAEEQKPVEKNIEIK